MMNDAAALDAIAAEISAWKKGEQDSFDTTFNVERIVDATGRVFL